MYKWAMESIGTVLFETRLGCLDDPLPPDVQSFIDAIGEMFFTLIPSFILYDFQKKHGLTYVKRHFAAWDTVFAFVRKVVARLVASKLLSVVCLFTCEPSDPI